MGLGVLLEFPVGLVGVTEVGEGLYENEGWERKPGFRNVGDTHMIQPSEMTEIWGQ